MSVLDISGESLDFKAYSAKSLNFKAYSHTPERVDVGRRTVSDKLRLLVEMSVLDISTKSLDFKADRTLFHQSHICRSLSTGNPTHAQAIAQPSERSQTRAARLEKQVSRNWHNPVW